MNRNIINVPFKVEKIVINICLYIFMFMTDCRNSKRNMIFFSNIDEKVIFVLNTGNTKTNALFVVIISKVSRRP